MRKSFLLLLISFLCFNFGYAKTHKRKKYNFVLSPREFRILWGTYLLERGNRKRLWKLLNETKEIKDNITLLNRKIDNLTLNQYEIKKEIKALNDKLDNLTRNISKILFLLNKINSASKTNSILNLTSSQKKENIQENMQNLKNQTFQDITLKSKGILNESLENLTINNTSLKKLQKENNSTKILENQTQVSKKASNQKESLNETPKEENSTLIYEIEGKNQKSSLLDLTNDIENAIYYKGKGDMETYKNLIKKMIKKYPSYKSELEKCLKDPDYIFQLYIEVLNAESK